MKSKVGQKAIPIPDLERYISEHLDEAIEKHWIEVWYQPIIRSLTGEVCAAEALARWNDPTYGIFLPSSFLGILEEQNQIWKLDNYVLLEICKDITKRRVNKRPIIPVSINLSGKDFERPDLHVKINEILQNYHVPHEVLPIEISETILPGNEEFFAPHIEKLREDGYSVWLDDVGTWYGSFRKMADGQLDGLKFDFSTWNFLKPETQNMAASVVYYAKEAGIGICAEKVSTRFQYDFLRQIGCDRMQGYFMEKPGPLHENGMLAQEHNFTFESRENLFFYDTIGKVNVLGSQPLKSDPDAKTQKDDAAFTTPIGILQMCEERGKLLYANEGFQKMMQEFAIESLADFGKWINLQDGGGFYDLLRQKLHEASESGKTISFDFSRNREKGRIRLQKIADNQSMQGYLLEMMHLTGVSSEEKRPSDHEKEQKPSEPEKAAETKGTDSEGIHEGTDIITAKMLWEAFSKEASIGMFWKDTRRRFLGVNRMFLDYYGLESEEQVIGKTDEDIGWHINPGPFRNDEVRVLREGIRTVNVPGICIVRGEKRNIVASKMPIYNQGKVVGLLGYFRDVTSEKLEQEKKKDIVSRDDVTGLLNTRGLEEAGKDYEDSYFRYSRDFMYVLINFQNLRQFNDTYGHFKGNMMLKKIADNLRKSVGINGVIAHIGGDEFVVMRQFGSMSEIDAVRHAVRSAIYNIHDVSGISFTINFLMSVVIYSDFENYDVMIKAAEGQILEEQRNDRF